MEANTVREKWKAGQPVLNAWLAIPDGFAAEVMAAQGWDSVTVDMQHGIVDYQSAVRLLQAVRGSGATPLVRVPWNEPGIIMKSLDAGAFGVICPMVNSREDAERLVAACRYAPAGSRSFGPSRAVISAGADYFEHANQSVITFAMIETAEALGNLDQILSVPGLDAVYVGPSDLAISLGHPPNPDPDEPEVVKAITHIRETCANHRVVAGIHTGSPERAATMFKEGFAFATIGSDARLMASAAQAAVRETWSRYEG